MVRRAVIDVGTNSVKLLIADVRGREGSPVFEDSKQTRLGEGFYVNHRLSANAISKTAEAVANYARIAKEQGSVRIEVIATSAARDAANAVELTQAIEKASGCPVKIISGEQEAEWAFQGVSSD